MNSGEQARIKVEIQHLERLTTVHCTTITANNRIGLLRELKGTVIKEAIDPNSISTINRLGSINNRIIYISQEFDLGEQIEPPATPDFLLREADSIYDLNRDAFQEALFHNTQELDQRLLNNTAWKIHEDRRDARWRNRRSINKYVKRSED